MFCDYQISLGNTTNLNSNLKGGGGKRYSIFQGRRENLIWGT